MFVFRINKSPSEKQTDTETFVLITGPYLLRFTKTEKYIMIDRVLKKIYLFINDTNAAPSLYVYSQNSNSF